MVYLVFLPPRQQFLQPPVEAKLVVLHGLPVHCHVRRQSSQVLEDIARQVHVGVTQIAEARHRYTFRLVSVTLRDRLASDEINYGNDGSSEQTTTKTLTNAPN